MVRLPMSPREEAPALAALARSQDPRARGSRLDATRPPGLRQHLMSTEGDQHHL